MSSLNVTRIIVGTIVAVALIAGLWALGWQITRANVAQQREVNHTSQQWQDARITEQRNRVQGYDTATNEAQKKLIQMTFCASYPEIVNPPADLVSAHARIC